MSDHPHDTLFYQTSRAFPPETSNGRRSYSRRTADRQLERSLSSQIAISALLETGLEPMGLIRQLEIALDIILSIPWLAVEDQGSIFLTDEQTGEQVLVAQRNLSGFLRIACARVAPGFCLCGKAAESRSIVFSEHLDERHDTRYEGIKGHGHYCVPILCRNRLLGVLNLYVVEGHKQTPGEDAFLTTIAFTLAGIIERRKMEAQLEQQAQFVTGLIAHSMDMIIAVDKQGKILEFNPSAQTTFGYQPTEVLGEAMHMLFANGDQADQVAVITRSHGQFSQEINYKRKNGETFPAFLSCAPLLDDEGNFSGMVANARDITTEKKIKQLTAKD